MPLYPSEANANICSHIQTTGNEVPTMSRCLWPAVCLLLAGCGRTNLKESLAKVPAAEGGPMLLAVYQPWFGNGEHIDVGYTCHDPAVLRRQIAQAKELNVGGFVVNWYGPRKEFEDTTYGLLQQAAAESGFK